MQVETKFLRFSQPAAWGEQIDVWKVCWLGFETNTGEEWAVTRARRVPPGAREQ